MLTKQLVYTNINKAKLGKPNVFFELMLYNANLRGDSMPLSMVNVGETRLIRKIGGQTETKQFLEKLGFVVGGEIKVVSVMGGNLIVQVKEARVAISKEMALKIMV